MSNETPVEIKITGITPLLMHNVRLANPIDPYTKKLAAAWSAFKKDKTDQNFTALNDAEWLGGLYFHDKDLTTKANTVFVPASWVQGSFVRGGVLYGRKGTAVKQGLIIEEIEIELLHNGGDISSMIKDPAFRNVQAVTVGTQKVQRCRPKFETWGLTTTAVVDETVLDLDILRTIATKAGKMAGMGDYRPQCGGPYGRYSVKITKIDD